MNWLLVLGIAGMIISLAMLQQVNPGKWLKWKYMRIRQCVRDTGNPVPLFMLFVLIVAIINIIGWDL